MLIGENKMSSIGIVAMIGAYFLYKNTPKINNHQNVQHT
ncbi:hypothetical protein SPONN_1343 [uncultured Candidatus Thioglobus sp.]|nr:hypothetical protein SPONN_1343 [uncultured Candidatus Thioglobus sp.]